MIDANKLKKIQDCKGKIKEIIGDEGVLQLAKNGICPHYVITNPITKEESIWFIPSELNFWFDNNFVKFRENTFVQNYTFIHFNKDIHKANENIPPQLSKIKELYKLPIDNLSTPPGVYFLCKNNIIKYVGQSSNISHRIITHINENKKDFDTVFFITCPLNRLNELETSLIKYFQPEYNDTCKINPNEKEIKIVNSLF